MKKKLTKKLYEFDEGLSEMKKFLVEANDYLASFLYKGNQDSIEKEYKDLMNYLNKEKLKNYENLIKFIDIWESVNEKVSEALNYLEDAIIELGKIEEDVEYLTLELNEQMKKEHCNK